jgi:aspartate/methionine/tyrosine aminotransferase
MTVAEVLAFEDGARERLESLRLTYTESSGSPGLRREIAAVYRHVAPDDVLVHSGAEEAIYAFMRATLRAGDRVVVQVPCYQSLSDVARSQGCAVDRWEAVEAEGWAPRLDELEALLTPQTRAIVVNTPHNPTGYAFDEAALRALVEIADRRGVLLFCDEVYRELELDVPLVPAACDLSPNAVSLGVMSKVYGLAGLRVGWLATRNAAVRGAVAAYKDYLTICNSGPSELLAEVALRHRHRLHAGPIAFVRLLGDEGAEALCERLAREAGVLLLPSTCYDYGDRHLRFGYGRANFSEALARLAAALS